MKLGCSLPVADIGTGPSVLRDYAQAAEGLGYAFWKEAGVTHVTVHTTYVSGHHKRIAGHSAADHLAAITQYREAVADLL